MHVVNSCYASVTHSSYDRHNMSAITEFCSSNIRRFSTFHVGRVRSHTIVRVFLARFRRCKLGPAARKVPSQAQSLRLRFETCENESIGWTLEGSIFTEAHPGVDEAQKIKACAVGLLPVVRVALPYPPPHRFSTPAMPRLPPPPLRKHKASTSRTPSRPCAKPMRGKRRATCTTPSAVTPPSAARTACCSPCWTPSSRPMPRQARRL